MFRFLAFILLTSTASAAWIPDHTEGGGEFSVAGGRLNYVVASTTGHDQAAIISATPVTLHSDWGISLHAHVSERVMGSMQEVGIGLALGSPGVPHERASVMLWQSGASGRGVQSRLDTLKWKVVDDIDAVLSLRYSAAAHVVSIYYGSTALASQTAYDFGTDPLELRVIAKSHQLLVLAGSVYAVVPEPALAAWLCILPLFRRLAKLRASRHHMPDPRAKR